MVSSFSFFHASSIASILLAHGKLNEPKSIELASPDIHQGCPHLMEKWMRADTLTSMNALSTILVGSDVGMALSLDLFKPCHQMTPEFVISFFRKLNRE
jgi:hypothetical protein